VCHSPRSALDSSIALSGWSSGFAFKDAEIASNSNPALAAPAVSYREIIGMYVCRVAVAESTSSVDSIAEL